MMPSRRPAAGIWKKVPTRKRSPSEVKETPTGLSMPPVNTGSNPLPSGRERKMWEARVTNGRPSPSVWRCSAKAPLVQ